MKNYTKFFESKTRLNDERFFCLKDDPQGESENKQRLKILIRKIHDELFDSMPNDWIYEQIYYCLERLEQIETEDQYHDCISEISPNCYTSELLEWCKNYCFISYVDEELNENNNFDSFDSLIRMAQTRAIERIYSYVWEFLNEEIE